MCVHCIEMSTTLLPFSVLSCLPGAPPVAPLALDRVLAAPRAAVPPMRRVPYTKSLYGTDVASAGRCADETIEEGVDAELLAPSPPVRLGSVFVETAPRRGNGLQRARLARRIRLRQRLSMLARRGRALDLEAAAVRALHDG